MTVIKEVRVRFGGPYGIPSKGETGLDKLLVRKLGISSADEEMIGCARYLAEVRAYEQTWKRGLDEDFHRTFVEPKEERLAMATNIPRDGLPIPSLRESLRVITEAGEVNLGSTAWYIVLRHRQAEYSNFGEQTIDLI